MTNKQVNELTTVTGVLDQDDYFIVYDSDESGSEKLKKRPISDFIATINSDITLYVTTSGNGGNDTTGDGSSGSPWATPNKALEWLDNKFIAADVTVTIQCGDGNYNSLSELYIMHPNAANIEIMGENTYDVTMNSIQSSSGSAGSWSIVLNMSDVSNIAANDYILVDANVSGGTRPDLMAGCWKVTNVDSGNTRITVTNTTQYASAPSDAVSGAVKVIKTIFNFSSGETGVYVNNGGRLGNLGKVVLVSGGGSSIGLRADEGSSIQCETDTVGIHSFNQGILAVYTGAVQAVGICISNCTSDAIIGYHGASISVSNGSIGGNQGNAIDAQYATYVLAANTNLSGNYQYGVYAIHRGSVNASNSRCAYNGYSGVTAQVGAYVNAYGVVCETNGYRGTFNGFYSVRSSSIVASSSTSNNSTGWGYYANAFSYILADSYSASGNSAGAISPSANTQGNEYSYMDT